MGKQNITVRIEVTGMTCTSCEQHVKKALTTIGANNIFASFRKNEVTFEVPDKSYIQFAKEAIIKCGYTPRHEEIISQQNRLELSNDGDYDLVIIGSGGAAFASAIKAVEYGAKVAMIERSTIGGTCVNIGCVPSKTMLRAGEINHFSKQNQFLGLNTSAGPVDLSTLVDQKNELVQYLRHEKYINLIDEYGFEIIQGEATFVDEQTVEVNGQKITAKHFLIATGASPSIPNIEGLNEVEYLTSTSALQLKQLPKRLTVIGSGYIAMELGQMFHHLGSEVTLMQRSPRVLKAYDPEISEAITKAITEQGISLITNATFNKVEMPNGTKLVHITVNGENMVVEADEILVATGRKPNIEKLNLELAGVKIGSHGEVIVDEYLQTSNPRVYAAGDVTMGPQFVYVAAYEGGLVADNIFGSLKRKLDLTVVPGVTFTTPSIATVGLTEEQAKAKGYEVKTSVLPLNAVPRAIVNRETTGVFKLVADAQSGKVLGVHIVAENAGDVIYSATLSVKFGLTVNDLRETLAPYLTMSEGIKLAALTFDKDVSKLSCCAG
ncbi:mercury(II) reductase [Brevibacillus agri]|uniref:mercury(II) reductase n=1 Tax=Brevibacillus agri TaxID=51101 RepID=UPI0025B65831|nr:mercury(II) reductase [Brevibacillus agri]MDN4094582.1 mercury(II) reductase [Brevibacillus agri]MED3500540.1 mercury(II) reductase [Brevibacillus agri]